MSVALVDTPSFGEETILVDRPGFKPGGWRHALLGGFDSHSSPPDAFARLPERIRKGYRVIAARDRHVRVS
jgi:hypothetical protein